MSDRDVAQRPPEQLEKDIKELDWRDLQLWGIGACVLLAVAAGFFLLLAPHLLWGFAASTQSTNLPQYTAGLTVLLLLLNAQTLHQRFRLQKTRAELVQQLKLAERLRHTKEAAEFQAYYDALTGLPNRTLLRDRIGTAVAAAHRRGKELPCYSWILTASKPLMTPSGIQSAIFS